MMVHTRATPKGPFLFAISTSELALDTLFEDTGLLAQFRSHSDRCGARRPICFHGWFFVSGAALTTRWGVCNCLLLQHAHRKALSVPPTTKSVSAYQPLPFKKILLHKIEQRRVARH